MLTFYPLWELPPKTSLTFPFKKFLTFRVSSLALAMESTSALVESNSVLRLRRNPTQAGEECLGPPDIFSNNNGEDRFSTLKRESVIQGVKGRVHCFLMQVVNEQVLSPKF